MLHENPLPSAAARWISANAPQMASAHRWASTGSTATWKTQALADEPILLLPKTPDPWAFWLGLLQHVSDTVIPIVLFKNAIPLFETNVLHISRASTLDADTWNQSVRAALARNPGLTGLFERTTEILPFR